jgi:hypothetical protein
VMLDILVARISLGHVLGLVLITRRDTRAGLLIPICVPHHGMTAVWAHVKPDIMQLFLCRIKPDIHAPSSDFTSWVVLLGITSRRVRGSTN